MADETPLEDTGYKVPTDPDDPANPDNLPGMTGQGMV